ncbi:NAD(P)-dependent dehydrogenase (short-subunit alcohol dehydrogenase family) [Roseimicrobium gellanilyticum]|uniref:NAD(P)-dependent dehydrogenase (Short-subunit alcohol dehydrogenase family) n=1 Tax=Roseimicrobium gellanilyticum TaxID=748857 RepID=A0A366HKH8_9BACT|nr:SDR family oxidoreductase [Roseimicrobium gellanilyticum]RBP42630.1 NAD(P)-dependent dehydrogenase (short-subunit alcohol dehydrogenase family) [Roseimicrobium gellanilyticum]
MDASTSSPPESPPPIALVTGGEGDLGKAITTALRSHPYAVHAPGRRELDVSDRVSITKWFDGQPSVDLVVHCAGVLRDRRLPNMEEEDFDTVLDVNLKGAFQVSQAALKTMARKRCGHIIFIGSNSARWGNAGQANYAAAKAGIIGLTHSLAKEYGGRNIRVNCILPGLLETKMTAHLSEEIKQNVRDAHSLRRFNTCEAVARFVAFLDRDLPHTSGQVFQLDSRVNRWT